MQATVTKKLPDIVAHDMERVADKAKRLSARIKPFGQLRNNVTPDLENDMVELRNMLSNLLAATR